MAEQWRDCIGFEGFYEVSDLGNVRRKGRNKNLAKIIDKDGYVVHCFCVANKRTNVMAHKLVAAAFIGPCPAGLIVRHWDGDSTNNTPPNLVHGTNKQNSEDMVRHGTQCKGERQHLAKLTEQDVIDIRTSTLSRQELIQKYGITNGAIWHILQRKTWKHVP